MQALNLEKRRHKKPWEKEGEFSHFKLDVDMFESFCNNFSNKKSLKFKVNFINDSYSSYGIKYSTIKRAIKNNSLDMEIWMYVNPVLTLSPSAAKAQGKKMAVARGCLLDCVIDLDQSKFVDENEVLEKAKRIWPHIGACTKTSNGNYHLWLMNDGAKSWNKESVLGFCCRFLDIDTAGMEYVEIIEKIKENGIDPFCLNNIEFASIRVGGSFNYKKSISSTGDTTKVNPVLCTTVFPKSENNLSKNISNLSNSENFEIKIVKSPDLSQDYWSYVVPKLEEIVSNIDAKNSHNISILLTQFMTKLINNECRICQTVWAEKLNLSQVSVSRLLKKLAASGIVKIIDPSYVFGKTAKGRSITYGAGTRLLWITQESTQQKAKRKEGIKKDLKNSLKTPYEDGKTWNRFLSDIRSLYFSGVEYKDAEMLILHKQRMKNPRNVRSKKDILAAWNDFSRKSRWTRSSFPLIDVKEIIEAI